jgi:hypothetical protein
MPIIRTIEVLMSEQKPVFSQEIDVLIEKPSEWSNNQLEAFFVNRFKALFPEYDNSKYEVRILGVLQKNSLKASVGAFKKGT